MNCKNCGAEIVEGQKFCANCGSPIEASLISNSMNKDQNIELSENKNIDSNENVTVKVEKTIPNSEIVETKKTNCGYGIAGMVLGILAYVMFVSVYLSLILAILGLIFSCISMKKFKTGNYKNKGFHITGLVLSIVVLAIFLIIIFLAIIEYFALFSISYSTTSTISGVII